MTETTEWSWMVINYEGRCLISFMIKISGSTAVG